MERYGNRMGTVMGRPTVQRVPEQAGDAERQDRDDVIRVLRVISASWPARAAVKKSDLDVDSSFDEQKPDFLSRLLPFHDHPGYVGAPEELKRKVLSCGWLAYNEKTIEIETKIISPACMQIVDRKLPGVDHEICRETISQAFVDEAYHTLMLVNACRVTRARRRLQSLRLPEFNLVVKMKQAQESCVEEWRKTLIQVVAAIVSEVSISDYLSLLSDATDIQPMNKIVTDVHRRDESAHSGLFRSIGAMVFAGLSPGEKELFIALLPKTAHWFADLELDVWRAMLKQIAFPKADEMIDECREKQEADPSRRDFSGLAQMAESFGVRGISWDHG
jgi:hypothetical protein